MEYSYTMSLDGTESRGRFFPARKFSARDVANAALQNVDGVYGAKVRMLAKDKFEAKWGNHKAVIKVGGAE